MRVPFRPSRAEVWTTRLDPVEGREQGRDRPALVFSHDIFNHGPAEMVVIVPLTTRHRPEFESLRVAVKPPEGGLSAVSYAMPDQIRAISTGRLTRRLGRVRPMTLAEVEDRVRVLLDL
ncbi:MAG: type II toxin-antitoxin system PemK/MazF family toxin [Thermoplasmata archaeon]